MRSASEIIDSLTNDEIKEKKYRQMMHHQEEIIETAIKNGEHHGNRLFYFSDSELFHGIEKDWYEEFKERAVKELKDAGYRISGITVSW